MCLPLRRCDPCQVDDQDAEGVPRVDCDCGRPSGDEEVHSGDCGADEGVDEDVGGAFHSSLHGIAAALLAMRHLHSGYSEPKGRRERARNVATPSLGIGEVLDDAYPGRWLWQPRSKA